VTVTADRLQKDTKDRRVRAVPKARPKEAPRAAPVQAPQRAAPPQRDHRKVESTVASGKSFAETAVVAAARASPESSPQVTSANMSVYHTVSVPTGRT
jgi:hypothetical protein